MVYIVARMMRLVKLLLAIFYKNSYNAYEVTIMLLTIDCGNTHLTMGLYDETSMLGHWRIHSNANTTEDEYLVLFSSLLQQADYSLKQVEGMCICSVVPGVNFALSKLAAKRLGCPYLFVDHNTPTALKLCNDNPAEVGADRIVNGLAAHCKYGGNLIIVDFGTATTFDCITAAGEYLGGAICPGIEISQRALFMHAAKLANIELRRPPAVIGRNTADGLRSGLLWGYAGQVDALTTRMIAELGDPVTVLATGGLASLISSFSEAIDKVDAHLTLDGLKMIWDGNRDKL